MACILPQDIIINILCRLPAKSVAQFRCVSKEWLSLLSEPQFIQTHQKTLGGYHFTLGSYLGALLSIPYNNDQVSTLTIKHDLGFYAFSDILGSVNGLVLAKVHKDEFAPYIPLVFNPTTKDYLELPISSKKYISSTTGFGYDSVSDDYKIVTFHYFDDENFDVGRFVKHGIFSVYDLRTNTWRHVIRHSPYGECNKSFLPGVFVNGFLHWIVKGPSKRQVILAFSLADQKLSELPPPSLYNEVDIVSDPNTMLCKLGEKLAIFNKVKGDIWLMNEYGVHKSWTKIILHGFNEIPMDRPNDIPIDKPKVVYDNGKVLSLTNNLLWIYDVEEQTLCKSVDISYMKYPYLLSAYAESLTSPKFSRSK